MPSVATLPALAWAIGYLVLKGYYLESLAIFAAAKAFGSWYLGSADTLLEMMKLPLLIAALFGFSVVSGMTKKMPASEKKTALWTFVGLTGISFFSESPAVSVLKVISIFLAYQSILSLLGIQKKSWPDFGVILIVVLFLADAAHRFNLWMPHFLIEGEQTNLYSSVWSQSQVAGIVCGFLFLWLLICSRMTFFFKTPLFIYLLSILYLSQCRTAMIGLFLTIFLFVKSAKLKGIILILGICFTLVTPGMAKKFLNKRDEQSGKKFNIQQLYSSRSELVKNSLDHWSTQKFLVGRGLGIADYSEASESDSGAEILKKVEDNRFINILGFKIQLSSPVEYGNLYSGILGGMGVLGALLWLIYFLKYFSMYSSISKMLFGYVLVINLGEAIMLSPSGNPIMLLMLCMITAMTVRKLEKPIPIKASPYPS